MKKFIALTLALAILPMALFLTGCSGGRDQLESDPRATFDRNHEYVGTTLNIFNWGMFMADGTYGSLNIIRAFERLTGINVNLTTYDSNEEMHGVISAGAVPHDIVIPSEYMIERMIREDLLLPLDHSLLTNLDLVYSAFLDQGFDPGNLFSVPYKYGFVGLIYNSRMFAENNIPSPTSWGVLFDYETFGPNGVGNGRARTINNRRDAFAIAQAYLGLDVNSLDTADWDAAAELLEFQFSFVDRVMDGIFGALGTGSAWVGAYYAGDFLTMRESNPDLRIVFPEEGTNMFINSMAIPNTSRNPGAAHMFINFLLEPEVAMENAEWIRYASPNTSVRNSPNYSLRNEPALTRPRGANDFIFQDIPSMTNHYSRLWSDLIAG